MLYYVAQNPDIKNTSATTLALMEEIETVEDLALADMETLTDFIQKAGHSRFGDPEKTAKIIEKAGNGPYRLTKTVNDSLKQVMSVSISSMRALEQQIKVLEKAIEQQFEPIPNTLTSIPGIGKVFLLVPL